MVSYRSRRAQTASNAAILVAIIGGLLVLYILFMPPADREQLLFGSGSGDSGTSGTSGNGYSGGQGNSGVFTQYGSVLVFHDTPGTLVMQASDVSEHNIPSATIFTTINTREIKTIDSAVVKNSVFSNKDLEITFDADRQSSNDFLLSFNVDQAGAGALQVLLNGHLIYERPIADRSPSPIVLPSDYLNDGTNTLTIEAGDVGGAFWLSNSYYLHNILITADIIDTSGAVAAQTFTMPQSELDGFDNAQLQFVPECDPKTAGRLVVNMNSRLISIPGNGTNGTRTQQVPNVLYSGFPDCGVMFKTDVSKDQLLAGENSIVFASQGGQYVVDRIKVVVNLKQNDYPVYYFNLPQDMYDTLDAGHAQLRLTLTFADYTTVKTGEVTINGFVQSFSTQSYTYQAVIDPGILTPGPNTITVAPHVDKLDIADLKIEMV